MEKFLVLWLEDLVQKRVPVDGPNVKQKALRIYKKLQEAEPLTSLRAILTKKRFFLLVKDG